MANGNNQDWLRFLLESGAGPEIIQRAMSGGMAMPQRPDMPMAPTGMAQGQSPAQLQPTGGGSNWLANILKIALPLLAGGAGGALLSSQAGVKAPHGGTVGTKPIMAQGLHAMAQSIEKKAEGRRLMEQAEAERKRKEGQEQWDREWKMFTEQMKGLRHKETLESRKEIAGMRTEPEPYEEEIAEQKLFNLQETQKKIQAQTASANALAADRRTKNKGEFKEFKTAWSTYDTPEGSEIYNELWGIYDAVMNGQADRTTLDAFEQRIAEATETMNKERKTINEWGQTISITGAKDHSKLTNTFRWMKGNVDKTQGYKTPTKKEKIPVTGAGVNPIDTPLKEISELTDDAEINKRMQELYKQYGKAVVDARVRELYGT